MNHYGRFKWENLGLEYPLSNVPEASKEDILRAKQLIGIDENNKLIYE